MVGGEPVGSAPIDGPMIDGAPLWIHHPRLEPAAIDDVVSTRELFGLIRSLALGHTPAGTILDAAHRALGPIALAEHFHYPRDGGFEPRYRQVSRP